jgi:ABC-type protease/lipase transport system fused ATPase/permease subunit
MDAQHHATIVDKLMQYRGKIPKGGQLTDKKAQWTCDHVRNHIDYLIQEIDLFAETFKKGLIR